MDVGIKKYILNNILYIIKSIPGAKGQIDKEAAKTEKKMAKTVFGKYDFGHINKTLPQSGMPSKQLFAQLESWSGQEKHIWSTGQISGAIYHGGEDLTNICNRAYSLFSLSNPLHPDVFPFVRKMESEVVAMSLSLFNGGPNSCGTTTSGGTESIIMAMRTYKAWALETKGITKPEMIVPETIHAAFDKGADYFGIKLIKLPVNQTTFMLEVSSVRSAITSNTIAIAGGAPNFPQGVMDPIVELAALAKTRNIGMHVDACLGGFLLAFNRLNGRKVPDFDFAVDGVTSMSADCHKYGYSPKGVSVVLYNEKSLRRFQYFVAADWTGGIYASPTIAGSRPGGLVVGAWAAMMTMGVEGYCKHAKEIMASFDTVYSGLLKMPDIKVLGKPDMSVISFATTSKAVDIYKVAEAMTNRHWHINSLQYPACAQFCMTYLHRNTADLFLKDMTDSIEEVRNFPERFRDGSAAIYGLAASIPDRSIVDTLARSFIDTLFKTSADE